MIRNATWISALILSLAALEAAPRQEIVLRPDLPAGEEWYTPPSPNVHVKSPEEKWVRKVQRPVMEVYPAASPNGAGVVIAPGGGFTILAIEHEGRDVARWLNERGVTAFVLRYRVHLSEEPRELIATKSGCREQRRSLDRNELLDGTAIEIEFSCMPK